MYIPRSIVKPSGVSPGAGAPKEPNVTIVIVDDILVFPMRDGGGVKILGNIVMKPGAKMYQFYQTASKFKAGFESEGDEDTITYKQKVEAEHPGDGLDINEFITNWTGKNVIVIFGSCSDNFQKVYGTKCAPLQLKATSQDDNDARKKMLVFEQYAKSAYLPGHYTGSLALSEPFAAAAAALDVNAANGTQYSLPSLDATAAVSFTTMELEPGQIVTLIGTGGDDPATLAQGTAGSVEVLLTTGSTWVALQNATINLQVFNTGATTHLIEVSRS
ncbi:MAG: hypothetical protein BM557_01260 [Flavobacterium sp. MedPE-SWcel]|uniref:hypothetical protein n=1 Tax=uncultured Flavobacterium sp. TaxID=165435 RepID=UPI0009105493|nr:hypothetical protein [uncultured Flavobacterium sp.]OIQ22035.1 MAG: hypothetical protein BM557_01260 [Flavobacterium sp. MedPE-SWcel]